MQKSEIVQKLPWWVWVLMVLAVLALVFNFDPIGTMMSLLLGVSKRLLILLITIAVVAYVLLRKKKS